MAQNTKLQPSFEDVFSILSQMPHEKLLTLKHKLKHLRSGLSSKLLQAMVLLTLGQEREARVCLDALGDNQAAQYVQQPKVRAAGVQENGEGLQPPQLDAGAMELLAQIYSLLLEEKLCSQEAMDKACQAATQTHNASRETRGDRTKSMPAEEQKHGSALSVGPGDKFQTLRSDVDGGFLKTATPNYMVKSSPEQIGGGISDASGPQTLCSLGSPSFSSHFEISASPTVAFHTPPSSHECVPRPGQTCEGSTTGAGQPDGDTHSHGPQETSWASRSNSHPGQDAGAQSPQPEMVGSCDPSLPTPEMQLPTTGPMNQPVESSDVSSTVTAEHHAPEDQTNKREDEKQLSTGLPSSRATADTGPAHTSVENSCVPAGIPSNSASASISTHPFPPPPAYSISSTPLPPPPQGAPSNLSYPSPLPSSPSPAWLPPLKPANAVPTAQLDGGERKFFTFAILHASEDELVAHRVKTLLESMGVPNGATLCEDFSIAGCSHMTCFQDAMENSAFIILLLTNNFLCNLCMFQTDTALMESIQKPSKRHSVIPFVPKENPLERSQIPSVLCGLVPLDENSPMFSRKVQNTFNSSRIKERKAMWDQMQREKLQLQQEQYQTRQRLAALSLGLHPQEPLPAAQPQLLKPPPQQWCPPTSAVPPPTYPPPFDGHPTPAQVDPPPSQPFQLPPSHYNMMPGPGGIIIQHARMVQIGNHNTMQVETVTPGPQDTQEQTR